MNKAYYCKNKPLVSDNEYDILITYILEKYPDNKVAIEGHSKCNLEVEKNKVKLPYEMWSMDKIKPDTEELNKWKKKYTGPYIVSGKLDGISGLYSTENNEKKLYTRGNGKIGQDISYLIPYLKLPNTKDITIRGEFIIEKELFEKKYSNKFSNPRNFVGGLINQKKIDESIIKDIDFVAYELIKPELKPSEQMKLLKNEKIDTVKYEVKKNITNELLSDILLEWRKDYKYEIDGIIVIDDNVYSRKTGNPEHAFAFKMVLSEQLAEAKVLDVLWSPSKDGYLKPRVQIEPIILGGVKIEYATGFNGKFIESNSIGLGSLIKIVRSGDVIPHIVEVIQPAENPLMPTVPYVWNETNVDIILKNKEQDITVKEKTITRFFKEINVEGLGEGNVKRIIEGGYDSIPKILKMNKEDYLKIEGFKEKLANKIYSGIETRIKESKLPEIMKGTNIFGRGFGGKKLKAILDVYPDILTSKEDKNEKIKKIESVPGMSTKTAEEFVKYVSEFVDFMKKAGLEYKLNHKKEKEKKNTGHPLYDKKIVMTGFRDKELMSQIEKVGGIIANSVSKNVDIVIAKDDSTGKAEQAKKLNISLFNVEEFKTKYKL